MGSAETTLPRVSRAGSERLRPRPRSRVNSARARGATHTVGGKKGSGPRNYNSQGAVRRRRAPLGPLRRRGADCGARGRLRGCGPRVGAGGDPGNRSPPSRPAPKRDASFGGSCPRPPRLRPQTPPQTARASRDVPGGATRVSGVQGPVPVQGAQSPLLRASLPRCSARPGGSQAQPRGSLAVHAERWNPGVCKSLQVAPHTYTPRAGVILQ